MERKSDQYVRQSENAASNIATWPTWMQRNLNPPKVTVAEAKPQRPRHDSSNS